MKNLKEIGIVLLGFIAVMTLGLFILKISDSSDNIKVDGMDALRIAAAHTGYWIWICSAAFVCIVAGVIAYRKQIYGGKVVIIGLLMAVLMALVIFTKPVNIKTDPKSSGITTEEIEYLKTKGLK